MAYCDGFIVMGLWLIVMAYCDGLMAYSYELIVIGDWFDGLDRRIWQQCRRIITL